jgi:HAD superfamily hydrolase (TIGR01509 family)
LIRAIIFDLDGTLADTEPLHFEAFREVFASENIEVTRDEYFSRLIGYNDRDCFTVVLREHRKPADAARIGALMDRKAALYQAMISDRDVLCPGAEEFVRKCAERFPLMIVTGTLRAEAEMILGRAKLRGLFADVIAAEDVERGKPEPDGFLAALGRLGFILRPRPSLRAEECLVIEDTAAGIEAAHRAGMRVLAVCYTMPATDLAAAEMVIPSFLQTDLDNILSRLSISPQSEDE